MNISLPFIVLIERRRVTARRALFALFALAVFASGLMPVKAHAAPGGAGKPAKIARDLDAALASPAAPTAKWARDVKGVRQVQVVVVSNSADPTLADLRAWVLGTGGSVHAALPGIRGLTVQIPANRVNKLAERDDVVSISPNRVTTSTNSTLEQITGALSGVRSSSTKTSYSGYDGKNVGIAILDSGVMATHEALKNAGNGTRIKANVSVLGTTQANWTTGVDNTSSLQPGSMALAIYEAAIDNSSKKSATQDGYGHGTHVAAVAAGNAVLYSATTPDTTGIAPGANIYDGKVLDGTGQGTLSDAIEGIQWVIYHAKEYNIRVLNVSLAAASTETWQTDPLCVAVRSATAAGITVVVAAGNSGLNAAGLKTYGAISSPGNDPSVITVGSVNTHGTLARNGDTVNNFSSRGPIRGSTLDSAGVRVVDNLLKPDLVAPGNKIVSAMATKAGTSSTSYWNYLARNYAANLVTPLGITQTTSETQMLLSGTSVAAPVVAGAAAVLLQVNPGLTPPLVKAILQYTAQPLPGYNLLEQGAGMINLSGAVALTKVLRTAT